MHILIVEDQVDKASKLESFCRSYFSELELSIEISGSLNSGFRKITGDNEFDLLLLDMSMPAYDITEEDISGGGPESFAGKELLAQMELREIFIPVVVITQYSSFNEGQISLDDLSEKLMDEYHEFYLGAVYYSSATDEWKNGLSKILNEKEFKI